MSMEVVNNFNRELKTLFMTKLPVSRQKMSLITKSAMKALKFYKHVVQSVEKFIHKCGPDYKVPGLYVIDAIVRQSRHQYCEKDVFGPRFLKNIVSTFLSLSQCDPKDMPLMLRVLNLWQKNIVFPFDLVQALIDLVLDPNNMQLVQNATSQVTLVIGDHPSNHPVQTSMGDGATEGQSYRGPQTDRTLTDDHHQLQATEEEDDQQSQDICGQSGGLISSVTQLLAKFQSGGHDAADQIRQLQALQEKIMEQSFLLAQGQMMDSTVLAELHTLMEELTRRATQAAALQQARRHRDAELQSMVVDKAVLDFDYGDDDSSEGSDNAASAAAAAAAATVKMSADPADNDIVIDLDLVAQLEQMTATLAQTRDLQEELKKAREMQHQPVPPTQVGQLQQSVPVDLEGPLISTRDQDYRKLPQVVNRPMGTPTPPLQLPPPPTAPPHKKSGMQVFDYHHSGGLTTAEEASVSLEEGEIDTEIHLTSTAHSADTTAGSHVKEEEDKEGDSEEDTKPQMQSPPDSPVSRKRRSRSRSHSGSRRGSKRSRRSRSRERRRKERERRRERDHDRRKNGLPTLKDRRVCIISRTVFLGHLHKHTTEAKVLDLVETFGAVDEFNIIPPRGCAFVTYSKRKSGHWAVSKLNRTRVDGKEIKVAWAPNRGIKDNDDLRDFWDESEGCTYIPFDRYPADVPSKRADIISGGGEVDPDSLPFSLLEEIRIADDKFKAEEDAKRQKESEKSNNNNTAATVASSDAPKLVMPQLPAGLPPMPSMPGMPLPFMPPPPPAFMAAMRQTMAAQMALSGLRPPFPFPSMMPQIPPNPSVSVSNTVSEPVSTNGVTPGTTSAPSDKKPTRTLLPHPSDLVSSPLAGGFGLPQPTMPAFGMPQMGIMMPGTRPHGPS